jgi:hypothetical protein
VTPVLGSPLQQLIPSLTGARLVVLISGRHWPQLFSGGVMPALRNAPSTRQPGMQSPYSQTAPAQHALSLPHGLYGATHACADVVRDPATAPEAAAAIAART